MLLSFKSLYLHLIYYACVHSQCYFSCWSSSLLCWLRLFLLSLGLYGCFVFVFVLMKTKFIRLYFFPANCLQFSSVTQLCPTLCDPMDYSMPGFPVHHQLPELTQTHIHRISDAIQLSHPLSSPSPHALNLSQHQGLFQWVSSSHQVAKVTYVTITLLFS